VPAEPEGSAQFEFPTHVRFHQADPAGVLFFGRVFELVSDAYEELIRAAGLPYEDYFTIRKYATPVVHAEVDYERPLRVGDEVVVRLEIERIGRSSLGFAFEILGPERDVRARGHVVHVFVDAQAFTTIPVPPTVRTALEALVAPVPSRS